MKNKHILIFILSFLLVISSLIPVYANGINTTAINNKVITQSYYDIATRLKNAGVLNFKSNSLNLDEKVTRQEAVSAMLDIMGYNLSETKIHFVPYNDKLVEVVIQGEKKNGEKFNVLKLYNEPLDIVKRGFKDVPEKAPQNYKNAVIIGKALGIVHGYNGNFFWDKNVTANEMYLLMLRVLNYKENPNIINTLGLNKNIHIKANEGINRGQMCQIIYNTLLAQEFNTKEPLQDILKVKVDDVNTPALEKIDVYSEKKIVLTFNEEIKKILPQNVKITNSKGEEIDKFSILKLDSNVFQIKSSEFVYDEKYSIEIINVEDTSGNLTSVTGSFKGIKKDYTDFNVASVDALFNNEIKVRFNKDIDKYSLNNNFIEIKDLGIKDIKVYENYIKIRTEPMTKNKMYELNFRNIKDWSGNSLKTNKFVVKNNAKYEYYKILDVKSIGEDSIKIIYGYDVDKDFVEDVKNYKINNGLKINDAKLLSDGRTVILNTSKQNNEYYSLKIKNKIETRNSHYSQHTFRGMKSNNSMPYTSSLSVRTDTELEVRFSKPMDIESIMDKKNISIDDLEIIDIKPVYQGINSSEYHKIFRIKTAKQKPNHYYKINYENLLDEYGNSLKNTYSSFCGKSEDRVAPIAYNYAYKQNGNKIKIRFTEKVTRRSAENISNYKIYGMSTPPIRATLSDDERSVTLDVSNLVMDKQYIIGISNIEDLSGNIMEPTKITCK